MHNSASDRRVVPAPQFSMNSRGSKVCRPLSNSRVFLLLFHSLISFPFFLSLSFAFLNLFLWDWATPGKCSRIPPIGHFCFGKVSVYNVFTFRSHDGKLRSIAHKLRNQKLQSWKSRLYYRVSHQNLNAKIIKIE